MHKLRYDSKNCFICYFSEGYKYFESLHAYLCGKEECQNKFKQIENIDLSTYRVKPEFRVHTDSSSARIEIFHLRNRLLNLLLSGQTNRLEIVKFLNYGIETMGKCVGGKPREFSVSNISRDVLKIHKELLENPELIQKKLDSGQMFIENSLCDYSIDIFHF